MFGYDQNAIAADPTVAIAELLRRRAIERFCALLHNKKIVAEAFVFLKRESVHRQNVRNALGAVTAIAMEVRRGSKVNR